MEKVTKEGSPDFVPVAERIATFENDGTLWREQPIGTSDPNDPFVKNFSPRGVIHSYADGKTEDLRAT